MSTATIAPIKPKGGFFLIEKSQPSEIFTPEDFTEEHRDIARTTDDFWNKEVADQRQRYPGSRAWRRGWNPA